jgi:anti-sigma B factor antagonist
MVDYFSVTLTLGHDRARLRPRGELDAVTAQELSAAFDQACADEPSLLLVDLAELSYCDSSGLRALLLAAARCASKDIEMRIVGARSNVRRIFELTDTAGLLQSEQH